MRVEPIDGFLGENLIVFGGLHRGGFISRGFEITAPDLENADPVHHNALESDLITMLTILKGDWGMQVQWMPDADFRRPLQRYRSETQEMLYCASSSGAHYDQREKELKGYGNVVDGIIANA